ncbi:MAG: IclR family transcriptional regulator [Oceanobacter sp.]
MTSPARVLAILGLFSKEQPVWSPDDINDTLGYSRTTGYRYVKELVDAGFLQKLSSGLYSLGPRIIELDYQLRQSDPLLLSARPHMEALSAATGLDCVLSVLFLNSIQIIDVYRTNVQPGLALSYGRGRPRPMLCSSAPKILLSSLKPGQLKKVYESCPQDVRESDMGPEWEDFRNYLKQVRRKGHYLSLGELEPQLGSVAVPVWSIDGEIVAALAAVGDVEKFRNGDNDALAATMKETSERITRDLAELV